MAKEDTTSILTVISHQRQSMDDPDQVDVWIATFLAGLARTNGMDPKVMAQELSRYFKHCSSKQSGQTGE